MARRGIQQALRSAAWAAAALGLAAVATPGESLAGTAEKRVALVIGNASYANVGILNNPIHDARSMSAALKRLGFDVVEGYDLKHDEMRSTIGEYAGRLPGAKATLVYYAGHGVSVAGENYLLPTDATLKTASDLDLKTINIDLVTRQMQREDRVSILILDACRNNPFKQELERALGTQSRSVTGGLSEIKAKSSSSGMMIAFATDPGQTALDGVKGENSPFALGLLKHLETPGISISAVLDRVRFDVFSATSGRQTPWTNSSLIGEFFLSRAVVVERDEGRDAAAKPSDAELKLWDSAGRGNTVADYKAYLASHPTGYFAQMAKNAIGRLSAEPSSVAAAPEASAGATEAALAKEVGTAGTERLIGFNPAGRREAQERLRALGLHAGRSLAAPDFRSETRAAIANWQRSRAMPETGYLTLAQANALWDQSEAEYQAQLAAPQPRIVETRPPVETRPRVAARPPVVAQPRRQPAPPQVVRVQQPPQQVVRVQQRPQIVIGGGGGRRDGAALVGRILGGAMGGAFGL